MWENMVDKIKMDKAFEYKLSKPYHEYSQVELANEVIAHKGTEDTKIVIEHNGETYVLYTIGCNNAEDFLNKYSSVLDKIGLSNVKQEESDNINSIENNLENAVNNFTENQNISNYVTAKGTDFISINNLFEEMLNKKMIINQDTVSIVNGIEITTVGCESLTDMYGKYSDLLKNLNDSQKQEEIKNDSLSDADKVEIEFDNSKTLYDNFIVMLNKKRETNQDIVLNSDNIQFTTEGCQSIDDMADKYCVELMSNYDKYYNECLNDKNIQNATYLFRVSRGNRYNGTELEADRQRIASEIRTKTEEYNKLFNKKDELDFNNPHVVYDWVKSLAPYINTHALTLPVGLENISYQTQDQLLLSVLRDNGYVDDANLKQEQNFYKYMVLEQMQQLRDYRFIPTEYNNVDADSLALTTQVVKDEAKLLKYKDRLDYCQGKLEELNDYEAGNIHSKSGNFDARIAELKSEIEELSSIQDDLNDMQAVNNNLKTSTTILETLRDNGELNGLEIAAVDSFMICQNFPMANNINNALNFAKKLPDNSKVKVNLIDGITNLTRRYLSKLDEDDINAIESSLSDIDVTLGIASSVSQVDKETEIKSRLEEIEKLNAVKEERINKGIAHKEKIQEEINNLETKIQELNDKLGHVVTKPSIETENEYDFENLKKDSIFSFIPIISIKEVPKKLYDKLPEKFKKLLSNLSVKRILERDLNSYNNEVYEDEITVEEVIDNDIETKEEDEYDFENLKKNSIFSFISIKEIKEIPKTLADKISGKFGALVERFKKNKSDKDENPFWENSNLEEIAKEGSIFTDESRIDKDHSYLGVDNARNTGNIGEHDLENEDDNLKKDSLFNFTPIQSVKKITRKLYDKISNFEFKGKVKECVETLKKHAMPTIMAVGLPFLAATAIAATQPNKLDNNIPDDNSKTEDQSDNEVVMGTIEEDIQNTIHENTGNNVSFDNSNTTNDNQTNIESNENNEMTQPEVSVNDDNNNISFDEASKDAISGTLTGESNVYTNAYDAAGGVNVVDSNRLYGPSWENATAGTYYTLESGTLENISKEQAMENYNNGGSVIQRVDNNGVPIGFVEFSNQQENSSGIVK